MHFSFACFLHMHFCSAFWVVQKLQKPLEKCMKNACAVDFPWVFQHFCLCTCIFHAFFQGFLQFLHQPKCRTKMHVQKTCERKMHGQQEKCRSTSQNFKKPQKNQHFFCCTCIFPRFFAIFAPPKMQNKNA